MKKLLFIFGLFFSWHSGFSQVVLNELYTIPGSGRNEFFELYNTSTSATPVNVDCYTIITYYEEGTKKGWYVMDLPNLTVGPKGYFVGASANPFNVQGTGGKIPDFNWNAMPAGGKLEKWEWNGLTGASGGYIDRTSTIPASFNDFFYKKGGGGASYTVLVYVNGVFANGLLGGSNSAFMDNAMTNLPILPIDMLGTCSDFNADFSLFKTRAMENVTPDAGSDNGFYRKFDGACGSWDKSSNSGNHNPGLSNGSATSSTSNGLVSTESITCATAPNNPSIVTFNITGTTGSTSVANDFPVEVMLFYDFGTIGLLDAPDVYMRSKMVANTTSGADTFRIVPSHQNIILVYKTNKGCFDKVVILNNSCANLPVTLSYFNAIKSSNGVQLTWQTAVETNNSGFEIQRRSSSGDFKNIGFISSGALNGTSDRVLNYAFSDNNQISGYTFYRLKQIDIDGKITYSETRVIKAGGIVNDALNIFPNPSQNGKATIVLDGNRNGVQVILSELSGKVIRTWENQYSNSIQVDGMKPGIYLVKVVDKNTGVPQISKWLVQ